MKICDSIVSCRDFKQKISGSVGFVPTMGSLHAGHMALVKAAREDCDNVIVSIFVNPSQFGPTEDLGTYPRDMARDLSLLKKANVDVVFSPSRDEMYSPGFCTSINVADLDKQLEAASRPHFFTGVATVVLKLLNIVQPDFAYFGRKDAQQLRVIQRMVSDLDLPVSIVPVPTVRESDGLAMSTRNAYLNAKERKAATVLWRALGTARKSFQKGEKSVSTIKFMMAEIIGAEPSAQIDYISVADNESLEELKTIKGEALISLAVKIGKTRLIDNLTVGKNEQ